jgi:uncharacterized protein (DUF1015 family)
VSAPPYDVVSTAEARQLAEANPVSFLRVSRPEIALPEQTDPHAPQVYAAGRDQLATFVRDGVLRQDENESYYVYRQVWHGRAQTGVVACVSVQDYVSGVIRTHEHTRPDKENDRARHIDVLDAHDEPVFLVAPTDPVIATQIADVVSREPEYDFFTEDHVRHTLWVVDSSHEVETLHSAFAALPTLYIADGHHRSAAAQVVHQWRIDRTNDSPQTLASVFPAVIFPLDEPRILPYNRVVNDLGDHTDQGFLKQLADDFEVAAAPGPVEPERRHDFGLYLSGQWFRLRARNTQGVDQDPVAGLDVSLLQDRVLRPLLGIIDPRTDDRLAFVGGVRGTAELERLVDSGEAAAAFSLHPTSADELLAVADAGEVMPPKSTWFEPKLRSGLFVHAMEVWFFSDR